MFQLKRHTFKFALEPTIKYNVKLDAHLFGMRVNRAKKGKKVCHSNSLKSFLLPMR